MKFDEYKQNIKSGDLLIWSTRGVHSYIDLLCQIVRIATKSEYDHVGMAVVEDGEVFVFEAVPPKVRKIKLSKKIPFYHIAMDVKWNTSVAQYIDAKIGQDYSKWQAFISYFTKPPVDKKWQCVELMKDVYRFLGIEFNCGDTPAELVDEVMKNTGNGMRMIVK